MDNCNAKNIEQQVLENSLQIKKILQSLGSALPQPIAGPQGPQGATGERGPKGEEGVGIIGFGSELPLSARLGEWFIRSESDEEGLNYFFYRYVNYHWVRQFSIRGPKGVGGPAGGSEVIANPVEEATDILATIKIDGVNYFIEGEVGPQGPAGPEGPAGPAGTIDADTLYNIVEGSATINVDYNETSDKVTFRLDDTVIENIDAAMSAVDEIEALVPSEASSSNKLADKQFVNSSIATNTANFRGTFNSVGSFPSTGNTPNDYVFLEEKDATTQLVTDYKRYKWNGSTWVFEFTLNNSSFTASQWAAINSGLTANDKTALNGKEIKGKLTIGGTTYNLVIGSTPAAGNITFELED